MNDSTLQLIGLIAGFLTSVSLLPQLIKIYKQKKADDISIPYLALLIVGQGVWITYGILRGDIPVVGTNIFSVVVAFVTLFLKLKYNSRK